MEVCGHAARRAHDPAFAEDFYYKPSDGCLSYTHECIYECLPGCQ